MNAPPAPKKGPNVLLILLVIFGTGLVMAFATCAAGAFWVKREADKFIEGGEFVLVSPPAVKSELAGPRKDYVGTWRSNAGSTFAIDENGQLEFSKDEPDGKEQLRAPIAAFEGNDIKVHAFVTITVPVSEPPHKVDGRWRMTAKGITFFRAIEN